jgi:hypothetical protein
MRRRIWWSIYVRLQPEFVFAEADSLLQVRDRQFSASMGLPSWIRDEDCDVDMLSASDLEEAGAEKSASDIFGTSEPEHITYALAMVKLAKLRKCGEECSLRTRGA